ncbi:TetR/AcrR family transcriptional regulator [Bailinhaonella thermotolerans]|uniref:TetR family transcriptional regulator n=1 Tax=Bailinhaonella thermotolerans TaxID=1070861 RepID=A0A3A4B6G0_9ACTN|nr:TetR/AcrR family transcriptional regulator [Bailinhaonella thermotolerans]RJL33611.1 TetR family transcriptional regulator [Bailinhaonella thermotolerans]
MEPVTDPSKTPGKTHSSRKRMTGKERREQLVEVGRAMFAEKGFDGTSIERIAARAKVSKPVVYEHFGGKEGLYAVVVDREVERLLAMVTAALAASNARTKLERAAMALLQYVEENSEGFRILVRDSHAASGTGTFASLINDIASQVEDVLGAEFKQRGYDPKNAGMYAQMLVGMVALTGQWWLDERKPKREDVAAHLVNLAWNGLTGLEPSPRLSAPGRIPAEASAEAAREAAREAVRDPKARAKELKELEKQRQKELKELEKARAKREKELRELEKAQARELKELEKQRQKELKAQARSREEPVAAE